MHPLREIRWTPEAIHWTDALDIPASAPATSLHRIFFPEITQNPARRHRRDLRLTEAAHQTRLTLALLEWGDESLSGHSENWTAPLHIPLEFLNRIQVNPHARAYPRNRFSETWWDHSHRE